MALGKTEFSKRGRSDFDYIFLFLIITLNGYKIYTKFHMKFLLLYFTLIIPQLSFSQTIKSIDIDTYKYLVIDEISGKHSGEIRRFLVKNLKEAGYNIVNLKEPLKTHTVLPDDLKNDPELALYLLATEDNTFCITIEIKLMDASNSVKHIKSGESCSLLSTAVKKSISSLTSYNYEYQPNCLFRRY